MPKIIYFDEHEELSDDNLVVFFEPCNNKASDSKTQDNTKAVDLLKELVEDAISPLKLYGMPDKDEAPKYLGVSSDDGCTFAASYYIGATWLNTEKDSVAVVLPKVKQLDYVKMFSEVLNVCSKNEQDYFAKCYGIDFESPKIALKESKLTDALTVLITVHYLSLVEKVAKRGLKKGYVNIEDNLKLKIKGRIKPLKNIKTNEVKKKIDHIYCAFTVFTEDIPENRLLKKALIFCKYYLSKLSASGANSSISTLSARVNKALSLFRDVSDSIRISDICSIKSNKLYHYYAEAINTAKLVLKKADYSLHRNAENKNLTFPFWINMPALFELYVYSILKKAYPGQIKFQVQGRCKTRVDYIKFGPDEKVIIDAKYKPKYRDSQKGMIDDIREISGYARDEKILSQLYGNDIPNQVPACLIVVPEETKFDDEDDPTCNVFDFSSHHTLLSKAKKIKGFTNFYKICIPVPSL